MNLIDRQAILKHIEKIQQNALMMDDIHGASIVMKGMDLCEKAVRNQPSAQPEIIHCGDCRYKDYGIDEDGMPFLKCLNGRSYGGIRINDFCSYAERKTDEQSDRQVEIDTMEKRIKDCNPDHFDYNYCSVRRNYNGKELPSEFCRYCGACMEVDDAAN